MGMYINPAIESKESFLRKYGEEVPIAPSRYLSDDGSRMVVCLVNNGWMTAAGIAYSQEELDVFKMEDGRPKHWFFVRNELLEPYM